MERADVTIERGTPGDLPAVQRLADIVWRAYYPGIVPLAQIDYMLEHGYADAVLAKFVRDDGAGLALARADGALVGFAAWYRPGEPATTKLDKLYVDVRRHGTGIGRALIAHVEDAARRDGARTLILNCAKKNVRAIAAYRACGFDMREATVVDIGAGFFMDDFILAKSL